MRYTEARLAKVANFLLGDIDKDTVDFTPNYDATRARAAGPPRALPQPPGQRRRRNRGRHGDQHPAAQSRRSARRLPRLHGRSGDHLRRADGACEGPGLPDRRLHPRPVGHPQRLHHRPRLDPACARATMSRKAAATAARSCSPKSPTRSARTAWSRRSPKPPRTSASRASPTSATNPTAIGVRIVIDLKRDATPDVVLNQLWRHTPAQSSFPANMLAIRGGRPETLTLRDFIESFIRFREEVITRRSKFELLKARERAHILLGLVVAVTNLDEVVKLIRGSASPAEAREKLLDARMAGRADPPLHPAGRSGRAAGQAREVQAQRSAGEGDPRASPPSPHRARPRRNRRASSKALRRASANCSKSSPTAPASTR